MEPSLYEEGAKQLLSVVVSVAKRAGAGLKKAFQENKAELEHAYHLASGRYMERYRRRHGQIKVLGMRKPIALEDVYTDVKILDDVGARRFRSIAEMEEAYRDLGRRNFRPNEIAKEDGLRIANDHQYLMVLGQPGVGKSTFLRRVGLECLAGNQNTYRHNVIPVLLELKRFDTPTVNLLGAIVEEFAVCGFPEPDTLASSALEQGSLLVLLDGLDEVPSVNMGNVMEEIRDFVDAYGENRFIASCRVAAYSGGFTHFADVEMADFDEAQIETFITRWFSSQLDLETGMAVRCWSTLSEPEYAATLELARTPLLLTLLCLVYHYSQDFPKNRAVLYREALDVLLKEWAAEKRIIQDPIYKDLNVFLEESMLSEVAHHFFSQDQLFFAEGEIANLISAFLQENLNAPPTLDARSIIEAVSVQQGILVERARGVYTFSHLTFQEYLTAKYVDDYRLLPDIVSQYFLEPRWREVFLLVAGISRTGADELLYLAELEAKTTVEDSQLVRFAAWLHKVLGRGHTSLSQRTQLFIIILAYALPYELNLRNTLVHAIKFLYGVDYPTARLLDCSYVVERKLFVPEHRRLACAALVEMDKDITLDLTPLSGELAKQDGCPDGHYHDLVVDAFQLPNEFLAWSERDLRRLEDYWQVLSFMVECKSASLRVSRNVWERIENGVLNF